LPGQRNLRNSRKREFTEARSIVSAGSAIRWQNARKYVPPQAPADFWKKKTLEQLLKATRGFLNNLFSQ